MRMAVILAARGRANDFGHFFPMASAIGDDGLRKARVIS